MGQAEPHQNIELLQAFGLGKVGHVAAETIARHLETCVACRAVVANASADNFLADLQRVAAQPAGPSPEAVPEAIPEAAGRSGHPTAAVSSPAGLERHGARPLHRAPAGGDPIPPALAASPDYEVIREINRGGMGIVYLVRNRRMDRLEGLKVVKEVLLQRTGASERFEREMRSAARLSHPNIVTAYSSPPLVGLLAFAMEYVDGIDLHQLVKTQGPLPVSNACYYVYQAAQGLQHAHERKMVHRDIKPNNLMFTRDGKKQVIKILDFGLAKATKENPIDAGLTGEGQMLGTPSYMAPEQIISAATADIRADIYSLGCTLYYLLTGNPPFKDKQGLYQILQAHQSEAARPLNELRPEVPGELAGIVARMIAKDPAQRFQQPSEIAQGLTPFFKRGVKPISVPSNSSGSHSPPPRPIPASPEAQDTDSPRDTNAFQVPEPAAAPPAAAGGNPEASPIQTMVELIGNPADSPTAARADRARQERRRRKAQVLWTGVAVGGLGLTFMLLWAGGVFSDGKLKSKKSKRPDSTASLPIDKHRPAAPAVGEFKDIKTRASSPITPEGDPVVAQTSPAASVPPTEVAEVHEAAAAKGGGLPIDGNRPLEILHGEPIITNAVGMTRVHD
jgi:serine/threonine protein kinase